MDTDPRHAKFESCSLEGYNYISTKAVISNATFLKCRMQMGTIIIIVLLSPFEVVLIYYVVLLYKSKSAILMQTHLLEKMWKWIIQYFGNVIHIWSKSHGPCMLFFPCNCSIKLEQNFNSFYILIWKFSYNFQVLFILFICCFLYITLCSMDTEKEFYLCQIRILWNWYLT